MSIYIFDMMFLKQHTLHINIINHHTWIFQFYKMFFTIKLPILVKLITKDKPIRSYIHPDYPLFRTLYDARLIPSLTE